jgi:hypothetical protein
MIIFKFKKQNYVYIHIPKCNGKYIRNLIKDQFEIIKEYWGIDKEKNIDLAHIAFSSSKFFLEKNVSYKFISFIRNPYDRIISGYSHLNLNRSSEDFNNFLINYLDMKEFEKNYQKIHLLPQYKFLENKKNKKIEIVNFDNVCNNQKVTSCELTLKDFRLKKYNLKDYFNNKSLKIFNKFYEKDFEIGRYKSHKIKSYFL